MAKREILLLGHENLYEISRSITEDQIKKAKKIINDLHDTIVAFKETYDYGRAIAAPQIDEAYRIIYMHLGDRQIHFINPVIEPLEESTFELWDDCMSFPGLEVLVRRYSKIKVTYRDLDWKEHKTFFEGDLSELFQHEYDHLDGILAVQRAISNKSFRINRDKAGKF
jgi:peptide deformylase